MVIANPIYDVVFKRLMQKTRIAQFFIETLLEETIIDVEVKPQEKLYDKQRPTHTSMLVAMALVRFDFIATIKTATGEHKKVLIEIQKARHPMDIVRFRNYLGLNYQTEDEVYIQSGKKTIALPIVSIYLLGFTLPEIQTPVLQVSRQYIDQISHKVIDGKNEFIEKLTHDCHVVQIPRIEGKLQSKLEQLLTIFEQKYFVDDKCTMKQYKYPIDDERIKEMTDELNYVVSDPETRKEIDVEQEAYRVFNLATKDSQEELAEAMENLAKTKPEVKEKEKELQERTKIVEEKDKELQEKDKAIQEKDKAMEEKDKAMEEKDKAMEEMARELAELKRKLNP
jgi:hypothetical protein